MATEKARTEERIRAEVERLARKHARAALPAEGGMNASLLLSPRLLVAAVSPFVGVVEAERRLCAGPWAELMARHTGVRPSERWDAALIQFCGYWSHFDHDADRSAWPIAGATSAEDFAEYGRAHGLLREEPEVGDILLQFNPSRRTFVRAGVVVRIVGHGWWTPNKPYADVLSVEGDTDAQAGLGGTEVFRVARRTSVSAGDRFLRWADAGCQVEAVAAIGRAA